LHPGRRRAAPSPSPGGAVQPPQRLRQRQCQRGV